jgi:hypothetical protein
VAEQEAKVNPCSETTWAMTVALLHERIRARKGHAA